MIIQLESIFDPDLTFELDKKIGSPLFKANQYTKLLAPMRVNIVGGGSWVTEFEALTGLDTRLFGYTGYYTHVAIGPYINAAFPAFMKQNGYATSAFFPTSGIFYNSRKAHLNFEWVTEPGV